MAVKFEARFYKLTLTENLLGTVPTKKDLFTNYVANEETKGDEDALVPESEGQAGYTTFFKDEAGMYLLDYQVKGFIKEAGNTLKDELKVKALRKKIDSFVFVFPRKIRLKNAPDGVFERPLRASTPQGDRVALAKSDYVDAGWPIYIEIRMLPHKELTWEIIENLLDYGAFKGLGQFRNGSYGRFTWEQVKVEA